MSNNRPIISIKGRRGVRFARSWRAAAAHPKKLRLTVPRATIHARSNMRRKHGGCWRAFSVAGIPVVFHWSALALLTLFAAAAWWIGSGPATAAVCLSALLLVREIGHACVARRLGYEVFEIRLFPLMGQCRHARAYSGFEEALIGWGGIAAQLLLLLPAAATLAFAGNSPWGTFNILLVTLSWFNAAIIVLDLFPARVGDSAKPWRLPLMLLRATWTMHALRRSKILL